MRQTLFEHKGYLPSPSTIEGVKQTLIVKYGYGGVLRVPYINMEEATNFIRKEMHNIENFKVVDFTGEYK